MASEAAKKTWSAVKDVLGWTSDPQLPEIPQKAAEAITASPDIVEKLLELLKHGQTGSASALVGKLHVAGGGKVVIAQNIEHLHM